MCVPQLGRLQAAREKPVLKEDFNALLLLVSQLVTPTPSLGTDGMGGTRACGQIAGGGRVSRETAAEICWKRINKQRDRISEEAGGNGVLLDEVLEKGTFKVVPLTEEL